MKKLNEVPESALVSIQTEHQKAINMLKDKEPIATIPTRPVRMRIDRPTKGRQELETVIVPETIIYYQSRSGDDGTYYRRNGLSFFLKSGNQTFPFGHIYLGSGTVCLGSIFVPSKISLHTPAQPLEALFLHNDHNVAHGGANLKLTPTQVDQALELLANAGVILSGDAKETFLPSINLIKNDAPWIISADVVDQLPIGRALYVMSLFYKQIFNKQEDL